MADTATYSGAMKTTYPGAAQRVAGGGRARRRKRGLRYRPASAGAPSAFVPSLRARM